MAMDNEQLQSWTMRPNSPTPLLTPQGSALWSLNCFTSCRNIPTSFNSLGKTAAPRELALAAASHQPLETLPSYFNSACRKPRPRLTGSNLHCKFLNLLFPQSQRKFLGRRTEHFRDRIRQQHLIFCAHNNPQQLFSSRKSTLAARPGSRAN